MTKFVTINKHVIAANIRDPDPKPPIRVAHRRSGTADEYCSHLAILDREGNQVAELVYSPHEPIMGCGARLVLKVDTDVRVIDPSGPVQF